MITKLVNSIFQGFLINKQQKVDIKLDIDMPTEDLLRLATQYSAFSSGYNFKMKQIKEYNWMQNDRLDDAVDRLELVINKNANFEVEVFNPELKIGKVMVGRMDCMDRDTVWEFKCTRDLESDHFIQLAIYALLNENLRKHRIGEYKDKLEKMSMTMNKKETIEQVPFRRLELNNVLIIKGVKFRIYHIDLEVIKIEDKDGNKKSLKNVYPTYPRMINKGDDKTFNMIKEKIKELEEIKYRYKLMNILTNEIYEIFFELEKLDEMVNYLLFHKYKSIKKLSDEEFIDNLFNQEIKLEIIENGREKEKEMVSGNAFIDD